MKKSFLLVCSLLLLACNNQAQQTTDRSNHKSIHSFIVEDLQGNPFDFSTLKGKKIMVVNTASECGLTPQYAELQALYEAHKDHLVIVGFPANNFMSQEPGSNEEIAAFCEQNFGVTFPMMSKISVKGSDMHPVYQFLTQRSQNGFDNTKVTWNFQKYLLDEDGFLIDIFGPRVSPKDEQIISRIKNKSK